MIGDLLIVDRDLFFAIGDRHLIKRSPDNRDRKNAIFLAILADITSLLMFQNFEITLHFYPQIDFISHTGYGPTNENIPQFEMKGNHISFQYTLTNKTYRIVEE